MRSPVLLMIFNRPETTARMVTAVREARPPRLYIAADGPRPGKQGEEELCLTARESALAAVDWPCEVKTLFRKNNLGCAAACHSAVSWFFRNEPEGIVLEDDIWAHPDFFAFCDTLLERYRDEPRVMHISGHNHQLGLTRGEASYYFSRIPHVWGWASWARAWHAFDWNMDGFEEFFADDFRERCGSADMAAFYATALRRVKRGDINTWDYRWSYSIMKQEGLSAMPNHSLTRNMGFGTGTHCLNPSIWAHTQPLPMPDIRHPEGIAPCPEADRLTYRLSFANGAGGLESLLEEGCRRLEEGRADANHELLRIARAHHGEDQLLAQLEISTLVAEGRTGEAAECLEKAKKLFGDTEILRGMDETVHRARNCLQINLLPK